MPAVKRNHSGDIAAFADNVLITPGCHEWTGGKGSNGRGVFQADGRSVIAARFALEQALGHDLLDSECALHHCDNPGCVRTLEPSHLFVGSKADNTADMLQKGRRNQNPRPMRRITPEEVEFMAACYALGQTWYKIAKLLGRAQQQVKHHVEKYMATTKKPVVSVSLIQNQAVAA